MSVTVDNPLNTLSTVIGTIDIETISSVKVLPLSNYCVFCNLVNLTL